MTHVIDRNAVANRIQDDLRGRLDDLEATGVTPGPATVLTELIDGSMIGTGATVIDVGVNWVDADTKKGCELVGDVDFESAREQADVITPVPGGVGPMTIAMLMYNTTTATSIQEDVSIDPP